jgi:hypothetical protein
MRHAFPLIVVAVVLARLTCLDLSAGPAPETIVHLTVKGRASATPSVAASGRFVAVAWGATTAEGRTDVFLATSRDAGATFGPPLRVNRLDGEARLGGELPPLVRLRARPGSAGSRGALDS